MPARFILASTGYAYARAFLGKAHSSLRAGILHPRLRVSRELTFYTFSSPLPVILHRSVDTEIQFASCVYSWRIFEIEWSFISLSEVIYVFYMNFLRSMRFFSRWNKWLKRKLHRTLVNLVITSDVKFRWYSPSVYTSTNFARYLGASFESSRWLLPLDIPSIRQARSATRSSIIDSHTKRRKLHDRFAALSFRVVFIRVWTRFNYPTSKSPFLYQFIRSKEQWTIVLVICVFIALSRGWDFDSDSKGFSSVLRLKISRALTISFIN